ncbi:magnesium chelatase ATPase subunit I [Raphidocelis subcapitata]|uniref:Mg-protoporphyrin IX chelatase n=1 Tax=Raphidocelis subcapitata TaxID=307507 RepID=A0A2V0NMF7_9CHLO|nr:magnesium chelatase ATPase subunit I [Raphidocelis subcapitata]|eukprot:GBF88319.1 magnesium chelatase ATPase subunit I [Raphidocelis subcapitata]
MQSLQAGRFHRGCAAFRGAPRAAPRVRAAAAATAPAATGVRKSKKQLVFPFVKIQGQEDMKLALLLNAVDSNIGGVLIMGDRGTAKSVAVRAVAELLPIMDVVEGDPFNSSPTDPKLMGPEALQRFRAGEKLPAAKLRTPLVELPLGATEDRICGTIDIEKALTDGIKAYEPGLLARANRGILYVDEVNLLDDGLVDVVLDSAASGVNTVEREGISIAHPAKFIMIGSGNPQEGELRPQLLDRFGMSVQVKTLMDVDKRTQMVLDRIAFEADAEGFIAGCQAEQDKLTEKIMAARERLPKVKISRELQILISDICSRLDVDGLRGDLVVNRAARALVAYEGRDKVTQEDVGRIITSCLNHRLRKDPLDPIDSGTKVAILFRRLTDPEFVKREAEAKRKKEEAEKAAAAASPKKAGAWGGLPGRR